jgi:hypothetical protein
MLLRGALSCFGIADQDRRENLHKQGVQLVPRTGELTGSAEPRPLSELPLGHRACLSLPSETRRLSHISDSVCPPELRSVSASGSRRASAIVPAPRAPAMFTPIEHVDYTNIESILANPQAKAQLALVMAEQRCKGNLDFFDALQNLKAEQSLIHRWDQYNGIFKKWIVEASDEQANLASATQTGFKCAHASCAEDGANASIIGPGMPFDELLDDAMGQMKSIFVTSRRELANRLPQESLELDTP